MEFKIILLFQKLQETLWHGALWAYVEVHGRRKVYCYSENFKKTLDKVPCEHMWKHMQEIKVPMISPFEEEEEGFA